MTHEYVDVGFVKKDGIAILTLNRPERLNALSPGIRNGIIEAVAETADDDDIKVMVITGTDPAFCAGADAKSDLTKLDKGISGPIRAAAGRKGLIGPMSLPIQRLYALEKPVLAAVNGIAAGGGLGLSLACDIRYASEKARFCSVFARRGLSPEWGVSYTLPRVVGMSNALELMWTGDIIDAEEAKQLGLVSKVVPHGELMETVMKFAIRLAKGPTLAIELVKRLAYAGTANTMPVQLGYESYAAWVCTVSEDFQEGVNSFIEKRPPFFKGR